MNVQKNETTQTQPKCPRCSGNNCDAAKDWHAECRMDEPRDLVRAVLSWGVGGCSDCEPAYNNHAWEIHHEADCGYWKDVKKLCAAVGFDGYTRTTAEEMDGQIGYKRLRFNEDSEPVALKDKIFVLEDNNAHLECYLFELHKIAKETVDKFSDGDSEPKLQDLRRNLDSLSRVMNRVGKIKSWELCKTSAPEEDSFDDFLKL